jgi:phage terminase large subunit GpA-like protein
VAPVKGVEGFNRASPVTGPTYVDATVGGKRLRRGARLWTVAVSTFKAETYRFLRQERPTAEEIAAGRGVPARHGPPADWVDGEWLKQLTAEQLVTVKTKRGFAKLEWQKLRERNEALDCRVYARAAAWIAGRRPLAGLARSRELVVTNGYAANACEAFAANLVGDGIKPSSLIEDAACATGSSGSGSPGPTRPMPTG